jgi:6-phosphogluconolactonase (cycloisomerase 2 family)
LFCIIIIIIQAVPADCTLDTNVSEIRVSNDGSALFIPNRGHDTVATFELADDGTLLPKERYATKHIPQAIELTPDGALETKLIIILWPGLIRSLIVIDRNA